MPDSKTIEATELATELRRSLANQSNSEQMLPPLVPDTTFFDELSERWANLQDKLMELLKNSLPDVPEQSIATPFEWLVNILVVGLEVVWWVVIAAIIAFILYVLFRFFMDREPELNLGSAPILGKSGSNDELYQQMQQALKKGQFAIALRLRWRLFTLRMDYPKHITPAEYLRQKKSKLFDLNQVYQVMFGGKAFDESSFKGFHNCLEQVEHSARSRKR